jgi:hypothetical protein
VNISIIIGAIIALACLIVAFRFLHKKRLIDDLPTSKILGVFIGLVELKGTAESETPLTSHLAEIPCVIYDWHIDEHWSRTVTETYRDAKGYMQTRTRQESGWKTVDKGGESTPFYLKDDTGVIRIQPDNAKIEDMEVFDKTCKRTDPLYFGKGPQNEISNSDHQRRFQEMAIPLHTPLYVMGQARERQDVVAAEITHDKNTPLFITSTRTEKQVSSSYGWGLWVWLILGLLAGVGGVFIANQLEKSASTTNWQPYAIAIGGFLLVLVLGWVWTVFNSLIGLHQRVQQAWAQVDVQLKRRHDLIPNLTQVVEGYSTHEREAQELVTKLRQQMVATPPGVAGPDYSGFTPLLRAIVERYPELKASELFLKLQQSLTETEQRIALARDYFNNIASFYNARLEIVPDRFVASLMRLHPQPLLSAADFERAPVHVNLAS